MAGRGILDKRSFLPPEISAEGRAPDAAPVGTAGDSGGAIGVLGVVALGMLGIVVAVIAVGVIRRARGT